MMNRISILKRRLLMDYFLFFLIQKQAIDMQINSFSFAKLIIKQTLQMLTDFDRVKTLRENESNLKVKKNLFLRPNN